MAIPDFQEFMLPLLRLAQQQEEVRLRDAEERLADEFKLTEEDRERRYANGSRALYDRVSWAKKYLTAARLLKTTGRGMFAITPRGEEVLRSQPPRIDRVYLLRFPEYDEYVGKGVARGGNADAESGAGKPKAEGLEGQVGAEKDTTPEGMIEEATKALEYALAQELLARILEQSPRFFERLTLELLLAMGYGGSSEEAGKVLGKSHDGGVDGVIKQDELGLSRIYIQAKRFDENKGSNVGAPEIQKFYSALVDHKASGGVFITTSSFTPEAVKAAERKLDKRIVLIDGKELVRLMIRHGVGCREETRVIKKLDEDFFEQ